MAAVPSRSLATVESNGEMYSCKILDPHVVGSLVVTKLSLIDAVRGASFNGNRTLVKILYLLDAAKILSRLFMRKGKKTIQIITMKVAPRLKAIAYSQADLDAEVKPPTLEKQGEYYTTDENPFDKRGFKYKPCRPDPYFESTMYCTTDLPSYGPRFSYFDRSPETLVNQKLDTVSVERGWRSARTNVGFREGKWYVEYRLIHANEDGSHVRFGIGRREAAIEAPVGYDGYGYGFRDKNGQKVHLSKPTPFLKKGDEFRSGDVVGLLIELPDMQTQVAIAKEQIAQHTNGDPSAAVDQEDREELGEPGKPDFTDTGVIRDAIPIKYRNHLFFEQFEYTSSTHMDHLLYPVTVFGETAVRDKKKFKPATLPGSKVTVYKNGKKCGVAFEDLFAFLPPCSEQHELNENLHRKRNLFFIGRDDGSLGYYPMVSCYDKGAVQINTSQDLAYTPRDLKKRIATKEVKLLADRYQESVVEEYVYDLVDETTSAYLDRVELSSKV